MKWRPRFVDGGVVFIDIYAENQRIRLAGYDNYWIFANTAGMFNDPEHVEEFGFACSYTWNDERFVRGELLPPSGTEILRGVWLPDEEYKEMLLNE